MADPRLTFGLRARSTGSVGLAIQGGCGLNGSSTLKGSRIKGYRGIKRQHEKTPWSHFHHPFSLFHSLTHSLSFLGWKNSPASRHRAFRKREEPLLSLFTGRGFQSLLYTYLLRFSSSAFRGTCISHSLSTTYKVPIRKFLPNFSVTITLVPRSHLFPAFGRGWKIYTKYCNPSIAIFRNIPPPYEIINPAKIHPLVESLGSTR